jgi:hypothetical protein
MYYLSIYKYYVCIYVHTDLYSIHIFLLEQEYFGIQPASSKVPDNLDRGLEWFGTVAEKRPLVECWK